MAGDGPGKGSQNVCVSKILGREKVRQDPPEKIYESCMYLSR